MIMKTKKKYSIQKHSTKKSKTLKTKKKLDKTLKTSKATCHDINKIVHYIEFDILFTTITTQILFLIHIKTPKQKIKKEIITLLKEIRNNNKLITNTITDDEIKLIYERIYNYSIKLHKEIQKSKKNKTTQTHTPTHTPIHTHTPIQKTRLQIKHSHNNKTRGGFFLKDLEEKGDEPITGNDVLKLLEEVESFVYNAQWTDEGEFLRTPLTFFQMLRGNVDAFKTYVTWHVLPKYYQVYPPFLKWANKDGSGIRDILTRKWEDLPDYLLAYKTYIRLQNEYLVSKGLKSPSEVKGDNNFFTKFANKLDTSIQKFQGIRRKLQGMKSGNYTLQVPL